MHKFKTLTSHAIPLLEESVDTDAIIPARFLKATTREGFGENLFRDWRFDKNNNPIESVFNDPFYKNAKILLTQKDFGIGSSREHATWALYDYGLRCIIGTTFGDIFYNNALKNGLLIVRLQPKQVAKLFDKVNTSRDTRIHINLEKQIVRLDDHEEFYFDIEPFRKKCLMNGLDDIGYILSHEQQIKEFESRI